MNNSKKVIIFLIVIIIIFVTILIALLFFNNNGTSIGENDIIEEPENYISHYKTDMKVKKISNANKYYLAKNLTQEYVKMAKEYFNYQGAELNQSVFSEEELQEIIEEIKKEKIFNLKSIVYNYENNIDFTDQEIYDKILKYKDSDVSITDIDMIELSISINVFRMHLKISNLNDEKVIMLITDSKNSTYRILETDFVETNKYDELNINDTFKYACEEIENRNLNTFKYENITNETMAKEYFNDYKTKILKDTQKSYELLEAEYREKRFGSVEQYKRFVNRNIEEIKVSYLKEYLVNNHEKYTEYVCKDQYGNIYIFETTAVMDYTFKLDTYTIETEKFENTYNYSDDKGKVMLNIDKWRQMINNRDYASAYKMLDSTFMNNNFGSLINFEEYMKKNYPLHYTVEYIEFSNQGNTYIQKIKLKDVTNENLEEKEMKIIMRLDNEGLGFKMSFEI